MENAKYAAGDYWFDSQELCKSCLPNTSLCYQAFWFLLIQNADYLDQGCQPFLRILFPKWQLAVNIWCWMSPSCDIAAECMSTPRGRQIQLVPIQTEGRWVWTIDANTEGWLNVDAASILTPNQFTPSIGFPARAQFLIIFRLDYLYSILNKWGCFVSQLLRDLLGWLLLEWKGTRAIWCDHCR